MLLLSEGYCRCACKPSLTITHDHRSGGSSCIHYTPLSCLLLKISHPLALRHAIQINLLLLTLLLFLLIFNLFQELIVAHLVLIRELLLIIIFNRSKICYRLALFILLRIIQIKFDLSSLLCHRLLDDRRKICRRILIERGPNTICLSSLIWVIIRLALCLRTVLCLFLLLLYSFRFSRLWRFSRFLMLDRWLETIFFFIVLCEGLLWCFSHKKCF